MSTLELFEANWRAIWNGAEDSTSVGAIYTKPEIVDLVLDLSGYRADVGRLASRRLMEPSCGDGAFLQAVVRRLIQSERLHVGKIDWDCPELARSVRAIDLNSAAVAKAKTLIVDELLRENCSPERARALADTWAVHGDFLLTAWNEKFSFVVGNPPYVRLEELPKKVLAEYRRRFSTLKDRADLYIAFFERGLQLLAQDGVLAFICANRFAKNQYGAALRLLISEKFRVKQYINLEHTQPFLSEVSAYPAIVAIDRSRGGDTQAGTLEDLSSETLDFVRAQAFSQVGSIGPLATFRQWYPDGAPWSSTSQDEVRVLSTLRSNYPVLEDSGGLTRVGIGVATGADDVFILPAKSELIESGRQIPLLMAADVNVSRNEWSGRFLVNPFADADDGSLVDLSRFPGLGAHFDANAEQLRGRHVAKTRPANWFRTIDRIWPSLTSKPKLVIPDIQRGGVIGIDEGAHYPHHNVYWITSDSWDLRALQALLRSTQVLLQVRAFSVQMRGGSIRYQAQTLRRIRIPKLSILSSDVLDELRSAGPSSDQSEIDAAAARAFGVSSLNIFAA
jgi:adenine-specific DNA-methyltransferase